MATAPVLDVSGAKARELSLEDALFSAEIRPHLVHETVRAELAAARAGTRGAKSRGMVAGGKAKPWRQKGTGRARQGTIRAPQFEGGGVAFPPTMRSFELKVNRKARKAALRGALSDHAGRGTIAVVDGGAFGETPSTKAAAAFLSTWGAARPLLVLVAPDETVLARSVRNLPKVLVLETSDLEVGALVWARSVLVTEAALDRVKEIAG
ncbi:MAG: 50S ribosomal protein L4 [Gaiellales bacterium]